MFLFDHSLPLNKILFSQLIDKKKRNLQHVQIRISIFHLYTTPQLLQNIF